MGDVWEYTGLKALGSGQKIEFLGRLFDELHKWTRSMTETYHEFPVGYTEWTLAGHLNIVAVHCGFMPYSEYGLRLLTPKRKTPKGRARPDLHIHSKDWKDSCLFELKRDFISLVSRSDMRNRILARMKNAYLELQKIARGSDEWAQYGCSALAFTVWIDWLVNGKDRWQKRWSHAQSYEDDWDKLRRERYENAVCEAGNELSSFGRVYYCGYHVPYTLAKKHYQTAVKEAEKEGRDHGTLPMGMLWVLTIKRWKDIT